MKTSKCTGLPGFRSCFILLWFLGAGVVIPANAQDSPKPAPAIAGSGASSRDAAPGFSWQRDPGVLALRRGSQVLWQFNGGPRETKPCFHPIALPGGPVLTAYRPADHPWHRGLWFSWKFINGVNYWEEDKATGLAAGRTEASDMRVETRPDFSARITLTLSYRPTDGSPVMTENRVVEVSPPDREGHFHMDWSLAFTAHTNVHLDRTPLPNEPEGKPYGGYAGLSLRLTHELKAAQAVTLQGPIEFVEERYRGRSPAMDYAADFGGQAAGIAILDYPDNLNAPTPWYAINGAVMHFFTPAVLCYGPHTLKAGQSLSLRYRVIVHPGRWDAARLREEADRYAVAPGRN
jgi:hypothetical protein